MPPPPDETVPPDAKLPPWLLPPDEVPAPLDDTLPPELPPWLPPEPGVPPFAEPVPAPADPPFCMGPSSVFPDLPPASPEVPSNLPDTHENATHPPSNANTDNG